MKATVVLIAVAGFSFASLASVQGVRLGTDVPPAVMAGYPMTLIPQDDRQWQDVISAQDGLGGEVRFSHLVNVRRVAEGWATWSHGYTGTIYDNNGFTETTVFFAPGTKAAFLYTEPGPFGVFSMTITGSDGTSTFSLSEGVEGSVGAAGFGFYTSDFADIVSIRINGDTDFGVGEIAVSRVPVPGNTWVVAVCLVLGRCRR